MALFHRSVFAPHEAVEQPAVPRVKEGPGGPSLSAVPGPEAIAVPGEVSASDTLAVPEDIVTPAGNPVLSSIPNSDGPPPASDSTASESSVSTSPDTRGPRQVPSQASDRGNQGADQLKE